MAQGVLHKLVIETQERELAHQIAGVLGEAIEPAPAAFSVFENGSGWLVEALFEDRPPDAQVVGGQIGDMLSVAPPPCRLEAVPDRNWVALSQAALPPVYAGRFTVYGRHDRERIARGPSTIMIDAGEAFGTAHHATTYGCLLAIDRLTRRRVFKRILDLGTGSGVLAIALHRALPAARIIATDLDQRSVEVAHENARINNAAGLRGGCSGEGYGGPGLSFVAAAGFAHPAIRRAGPLDLIVANILAGPLMQLAGDQSRALACGGALVLSGILNDQAAAVIAQYNAHGFALAEHARIEGWSTLVLLKRTAANRSRH